MKNLLHIPSILLLAYSPLIGQGSKVRQEIPESIYGTAFRIEVLKNGDDCAVISYVPHEENETVTPRDDRNLGVQYFVSGTQCEPYFSEAFASLQHKEEDYLLTPIITLDLDTFADIRTVTTDEIIADGWTKLFVTSFFSDHNTNDVRDDVYLGTDIIIDSADPASINGPFDLTQVTQEYEATPAFIAHLQAHDYYKLREMQVNKRLIVEKLRKDGKWKDITPVSKLNME